MERKRGEETLGQRPSVVILDDAPVAYVNLLWSLDKEAIRVIALPESMHFAEGSEKERLWGDFKKILSEVEMSRVILVLADQFYDNPYFREFVGKWLTDLHRVNKAAYVIETSFMPKDPVYGPENPVVLTNELANYFKTLGDLEIKTEATLRNLAEKMQNEAYRFSQILDPKNKPSDVVLSRGHTKLREQEDYLQFLDLVADGKYDAESMDRKIWGALSIFKNNQNLERDALLLHTAFMILAHIQMESDPALYSIPLTRFRNSLGLGESEVSISD